MRADISVREQLLKPRRDGLHRLLPLDRGPVLQARLTAAWVARLSRLERHVESSVATIANVIAALRSSNGHTCAPGPRFWSPLCGRIHQPEDPGRVPGNQAGYADARETWRLRL